jgi:SAM-dependent methyltransferase
MASRPPREIEQRMFGRTIQVPDVVYLTIHGRWDGVSVRGFARPEEEGTWTDGHEAKISLAIDPTCEEDVLLRLEITGFVEKGLPKQIVEVSLDEEPAGVWAITKTGFSIRQLVLPLDRHVRGQEITITFNLPNAQSPASLGLADDHRELGIGIRRLMFTPLPRVEEYSGVSFEVGRKVGLESRRTYDAKIRTGFWARYITGPKVLDIGCKGLDEFGALTEDGEGLAIFDGAIAVDLDYPGYDGLTLPFPTESQDAVYASHTLEHVPNFIQAIQEWHRVTKVGGHIIVMVPNAHLYERRRRPPSRWNLGHLRFYTAASLLAEFEAALPPNSYRVRHLLEDDRDFRYEDPPDHHPHGGYEIEQVVQKIKTPAWAVED